MAVKPSLLLAALLGLAACVPPVEVALPYAPETPPTPVARTNALVSVGTITDAREGPWAGTARFGTIRGGFGQPVRRMDAPGPVGDVVAGAVRDGLAARGLLAPEGRGALELRVRVADFEASQLRRTEAEVELDGALVRRADGAVVWRGRGEADPIVSGRGRPQGIAADPGDLRNTTIRAMSAAVDALLDDPGFRAAIR